MTGGPSLAEQQGHSNSLGSYDLGQPFRFSFMICLSIFFLLFLDKSSFRFLYTNSLVFAILSESLNLGVGFGTVNSLDGVSAGNLCLPDKTLAMCSWGHKDFVTVFLDTVTSNLMQFEPIAQ